MNRIQLEAMRDHFAHLSQHHSELAKKREMERMRMEPDHRDVSEERKHETLERMFSGLMGAMDAALKVTE